jgi:hypothetical protein
VTAMIVSNTFEDLAPVPAPTREDGTPFRYEMLFNGFADRAYADHAEDLLTCLIPRYTTMTPAERLAARLAHAVRVQTTVQADINYEHNNLVGCTPEEIAVLTNSRSVPPNVGTWSCAVPLVLVDVFYQPAGDLPSIVSGIADVTNPPNVYWLRPGDEDTYIESLAYVGFVALHAHADAV